MTEQNTNPAATEGGAATQPPGMRVLAQYIRDLSFENVMVDKGLSGDVQPEVEVSVALDAKKRTGDGNYEVIQKYKITSKAKGTGDILFVLELDYAGLFELTNIPDEQIHPFALIECPRMLFPYARRIVGDVTRDGGFPQLNLENVDFVKIYRQNLQRQAQAQSANSAPV